MLVNRPGKFIIEFPSNYRQDYSEKGDDAWHRHQKRLYISPDGRIWLDVVGICESSYGLVNLVVLNRRIDKHANIIDANPDDLNGVFQSQRIVDQDQLVKETEDE